MREARACTLPEQPALRYPAIKTRKCAHERPALGARMPGATREELAMKTMMWAAALAFLAPPAAFGQSSEELAKGATKTVGVINYGMGYNLQRYSPLVQINWAT